MRPIIFRRTRLIVVCVLLFLACMIFYKWHSSVYSRRNLSSAGDASKLYIREKTTSLDSDVDDNQTEEKESKGPGEEMHDSFQTQNEIKGRNDKKTKGDKEEEEEEEEKEEGDEKEEEKENENQIHLDEDIAPASKDAAVTSETVRSAKPDYTAQKNTIAVLVIACNRPAYVKKCIDALVEKRPADLKDQFPIIVSQDCGHEETEKVITSYGDTVKLIKQPDLSAIHGVASHMVGYYKLSRHYKWALGQIFDVMGFDAAVIVEDDLDIAPDFFDYFAATQPLLDQDPTIWCVSAWNDNGKEEYVENNGLLYRSDFFPGLGWMLKKSLWNELGEKWPDAFWDDWMRHPDQRRDRCCIRPEICRTKTFGESGVSQGQFYSQHLQFIKLNDKFYNFRQKDLSYLLKEEYDSDFHSHVYMIPQVSFDDIQSGKVSSIAVRVQYEDNSSFRSLAQQFGIMADLKSGVPRMAYKGVIVFVYKGIRVFLAPPSTWSGYT